MVYKKRFTKYTVPSNIVIELPMSQDESVTVFSVTNLPAGVYVANIHLSIAFTGTSTTSSTAVRCSIYNSSDGFVAWTSEGLYENDSSIIERGHITLAGVPINVGANGWINVSAESATANNVVITTDSYMYLEYVPNAKIIRGGITVV